MQHPFRTPGGREPERTKARAPPDAQQVRRNNRASRGPVVRKTDSFLLGTAKDATPRR